MIGIMAMKCGLKALDCTLVGVVVPRDYQRIPCLPRSLRDPASSFRVRDAGTRPHWQIVGHHHQ